MTDNRQICANCEHWTRHRGVYECWNRDSDKMYRPTLPDDDCLEFERKEDEGKWHTTNR